MTLPVSEPSIRRIKPGHLLSFFDWAAGPVAMLARLDVEFLTHMLELDCKRMHLVALTLAHVGDGASGELARLLARGSAREVLDRVLDGRPAGILRALDRLPDRAISARGYRQLVALLREPNAAKLLRHVHAIEEEDIDDLHALPTRLRRSAIVDAFGCFQNASWLEEILELLVRRGVVSDVEALGNELGALNCPAQFKGRLRRLVEALPLPAALPPAELGFARRLDHPAELRDLARRWRNCLASFVDEVDQGSKAIYLWEEPGLKAVCMVERRGRLGWFLGEAKGPRNRRLSPKRQERLQSGFAAAGIPPDGVADAIEGLCLEGDERPRRSAQQAVLPDGQDQGEEAAIDDGLQVPDALV